MDQTGQWIARRVGSGFCIYGISALLSHLSWQRNAHTICCWQSIYFGQCVLLGSVSQ